MDYKTQLKKMLDGIIAGNDEQARVDFHSYLATATKKVLGEKADKEKAEKVEDSAQRDIKRAKTSANKADKKLEKAKRMEKGTKE